MKNIKTVFIFIICMIITAGISVYATIQYQANEIGYSTGTVKDALDELYGKSIISGDRFKTATYKTSYGDYSATRTSSITLNKGKYIIVITSTTAWNQSSSSNSYTTNHGLSLMGFTSDKTDTIIKNLSNYYNYVRPTDEIVSGYKLMTSNNTNTYYVEVKTDETTLTRTPSGSGTNSKRPQSVTIHAIPID